MIIRSRPVSFLKRMPYERGRREAPHFATFWLDLPRMDERSGGNPAFPLVSLPPAPTAHLRPFYLILPNIPSVSAQHALCALWDSVHSNYSFTPTSHVMKWVNGSCRLANSNRVRTLNFKGIKRAYPLGRAQPHVWRWTVIYTLVELPTDFRSVLAFSKVWSL